MPWDLCFKLSGCVCGHFSMSDVISSVIFPEASTSSTSAWWLARKVSQERILEGTYLRNRNVAHQSVRTTVQNGHLFAYRHRWVLRLNQQLVVLTSTVDGHGSHRVHVAAELREGLQFTILCLVNLQRTGTFFILFIWALPLHAIRRYPRW